VGEKYLRAVQSTYPGYKAGGVCIKCLMDGVGKS